MAAGDLANRNLIPSSTRRAAFLRRSDQKLYFAVFFDPPAYPERRKEPLSPAQNRFRTPETPAEHCSLRAFGSLHVDGGIGAVMALLSISPIERYRRN